MNIASTHTSPNHGVYQPAPQKPAAEAPQKASYHGTQEQADAVAKQDTMVRKYHRPLGQGLTQRKW